MPGREVDVAAVPHPDGRIDAHRPAAREQHRPGHGPGPGRRPRRHPEPAHQRIRRGARAAHRACGQDRPAHPAGRRLRVRSGRHRRPAGRVVFRRVADRRGREPPHGTTSSASTAWGAPSTPSRRGFMQEEIEQAAYAYAKAVDSGEKVVVGVNRFVDEHGAPTEVFPIDAELQRAQVGPRGPGPGRTRPGGGGRRPGRRGGGRPGDPEPPRPDEGGPVAPRHPRRGVRRTARRVRGVPPDG